ncbi:(-)-kolavenyl diphosphate synthase TPS28, chloroplastic-like isoform X1 [Arachis stenosperma]|uniref:(-)-kolavenyl diphosphate synthase TPS28, chloroplastic-like isoform X1 n=1 Tax=Arachis stenosperma TaxID=217475 RepID=UPI0025AC62BD|nr:(-)-kolavenyl diphosphate synthase TPS28, chloroplastic-like isoform X1 [Arachis stenosperma]
MTSQLPFHLNRFAFKFHLQCSRVSLWGTRSHRINEVKHAKKCGFRPIHAKSSPTLDLKEVETKEIREKIKVVKCMLGSMEDGEISVSAYDTAWVGLVKDVNDGNAPQFPSCLEWIANNQLPDGSWGDANYFSPRDRLLNTLACVIAFTQWNLHPQMCHKGLTFFKENLSKIEDESAAEDLVGFEFTLPSLLDLARSMNIEVPDDSPVLKELSAIRDLKLKSCSQKMVHSYSLQRPQPTLTCRPKMKMLSTISTTLFTFVMVQFQTLYPIDLFERSWTVDRLERLGISRYFEPDIKDFMTFISRYWTDKGLGWTRDSGVPDIDDTVMAFRLLRLHGHRVLPDALKHFEKNGEFFCFPGETNPSMSATYNLYRASQVLFPGEMILQDAKYFSFKFLSEKRASNEIFDKWIITKDLIGEVSYALDVPWYASLPRLETRFYIEQYGGENVVWIAKTLYRLPSVNNEIYVELAKLDYNKSQAVHSAEWEKIQRWHSETGLQEFGVSKESLLQAYFVAAACIFEPQRWLERLAWAKTVTLIQAFKFHINHDEARKFILEQLNNNFNRQDLSNRRLDKINKNEQLLGILLITLDYLGLEFFRNHGQKISHHLNQIWQSWLFSWQNEGSSSKREAELIVQTINLMAGDWLQELQLNPQYQILLKATNKVCHKLKDYQSEKGKNELSIATKTTTTPEIESEMQEFVQIVLQNSQDGIKSSFFLVAKSFYYVAYFDSQTIMSHADKVLFQKVM